MVFDGLPTVLIAFSDDPRYVLDKEFPDARHVDEVIDETIVQIVE
jgi:hypothetical protein